MPVAGAQWLAVLRSHSHWEALLPREAVSAPEPVEAGLEAVVQRLRPVEAPRGVLLLLLLERPQGPREAVQWLVQGQRGRVAWPAGSPLEVDPEVDLTSLPVL